MPIDLNHPIFDDLDLTARAPGLVEGDPDTSSVLPMRTDGCGVDALCARLDASGGQLAVIAQELAHREREWQADRIALQKQGAEALARIAAEQAKPDPVPLGEAQLAELAEERDALLERVASAASRIRRRINDQLEGALEALRHTLEREAGTAVIGSPAERSRRRDAFLAETASLAERLAKATAEVEALRRATGFRRRFAPGNPMPLPTSWAPGRLLGLVRDELMQVEQILNEVRDHNGTAVLKPLGLLTIHSVVALPHVLALALMVWARPMPELVPWVALSGVVSQVLILPLLAPLRIRLGRRLVIPRQLLDRLPLRLKEVEDLGRVELDPAGSVRQRLGQMAELEEERKIRAEPLQQRAAAELEDSRQREERLRQRIIRTHQRTIDGLLTDEDRRRRERRTRLAAEQVAAEQALTEGLAAREARWYGERSILVSRWRTALAELTAGLTATTAEAQERHRPWTDPAWMAWTAPASYGIDLPLGLVQRPLTDQLTTWGASAPSIVGDPPADLAMPLALAFPSPGSLLLRVSPDSRAAGLALLQRAVLRALTSFPAGKLRLTLIDPVGLGESFAPLLELADHDEALLSGGVLGETGRIERGLEDLTDHLETVIQKHLRGRYATIDDYNREAGELMEPIRLVVVADFPAGFSERALERLGVLLRSGARCGVHLLVLHDDRKPLPPALDLAWFRRSGLALRSVQGRFVVDRDGLHEWTFLPETHPEPAVMRQLLTLVGKASSRSRRVEVAFAAVAPPADRLWSASSANDLRIPVGRRGADRLQLFELGKGTAQHALVGGRTGSGKSTLFHVLITSAALWYSPDELEFHLIDFKKGVEFKAYASHHLPHARVIAIESDREFGLSVLRNLDQELTRRGDAFRTVGAQDLAAYRSASKARLPRVVLLIDEFQEFFTEDDAIARDAALLLDRFVRQGRAFGVHVVLGSQTLGGAYSLAKSSLGQMGVRVALPCNEADAHLLLHEDNDAARLLSRPGDAIYNDRAGTVDGNSPFQVCWLPEEVEAGHLERIAAQAAASGWRSPKPAVVFEGEAPARIEEETALADLLARAPDERDRRMRAWIGQSSSIDSRSEVTFSEAAGGNLIIVGGNRESAAATCGAIAIGLAARHAPGTIRLVAIDGEDRDGPFAALHGRLAAAMPAHVPQRVEARELARTIAELTDLLEQRMAGGNAGASAGSGAEAPVSDRSPVVLTVFGLQRLRQLRPDDDLGFRSRADDAGEPPAECFAKLVANGPEYGIHVVVWCDSLTSVQRGLGRRALKDFDARILFQMSASDSTELLDDDGACRLGLHSAILSQQGEGRREKFRPYALPSAAVLTDLGTALGRRWDVAS